MTDRSADDGTPSSTSSTIEEMEDVSTSLYRVLSGKKGELAATKEQAEILCYLEDGTLLVSESHRLDQNVLVYIDRLRRANKTWNVVPTTLERIRNLYMDQGDVTVEADSSAVQESVVAMLREATRLGASDIHIVNRQELSLIRSRINGVLEDVKRLRPAEGRALSATIYQSMLDVAGDSYFNVHKSQDGRLKQEFVSSIGLYGARVATRPMERGHLTVMRLLYNSTAISADLSQLGYLPEQVEMIETMCQNKTGINIVSGATGSGKSLSLKCALELVLRTFDRAIHVLTVEDPPEYTIDGAVQTPVIGTDWPGAIRNAMRLDPDVILIGEIRDLESGTAAFRAAMTGHGVWTTLHANDNVSSLERLKDLGVDVGMLTDPALVTGLMNQSLVRKVCMNCSVPYAVGSARLTAAQRLRIEKHCQVENVRLAGNGCDSCRAGSIGRTLVAEVVRPNLAFMEMFRREGKNEARKFWLQEMGGITKADHMIRRINEGLLDPLHAEKDVGFILDRETY